ncbi:MAG: hypothetical protein IJ767_00795 [Bacteroidaceae bacterium]|nr:hypothetical protein [Bacteroidaceae bacterium]MBR1800023.1 hypothetical protein [Bacteroidaceae bacterium]
MKKSIFTLALAAMLIGSVNNTNAQDNNGREGRRADMQARQTERLVKSLKLTDEQKAKFEPLYLDYQKELGALRPQRQKVDGQTGASAQEQSGKKAKEELTDAVATARLQEQFDRQAKEIELSQQRLDIQKKYCAEFSAFLTPQQLLKVFQPQEQQNRQRMQQGGRGGQGGPRGGMGGGRGGFGGGPQGGFGGSDF